MKISIVIPIYNSIEYTKKCLQNLYLSINQSECNHKLFITIVDDGSTDGSSEWIGLNFPDVVLLKGNGQLWWSGGVNVGIKHALDILKCDFILLWNNDIKPGLDYFHNLYEIIDNTDKIDIIASKVYYLDNPELICNMGFLFNLKTGKKKVIGHKQPDSAIYDKIIEADCTGGQGVLISKNVFEKIGFFDEKTFPQYHADFDFTLRAKKGGFKILTYPNLKIWNDVNHTGIGKSSFFSLMDSLSSIRSNYNITKDIRFYYRHTTSIFAYFALLEKYFRYFGGYIKWKFLNFFMKKDIN